MSGHWSEILRKNGACPEAVAFAAQFATLKQAWKKCRRTSWLDWLLSKIESDEQVPREIRDAYAEIAYPYGGTERELRQGISMFCGPSVLRGSCPLTWTQLAKHFEVDHGINPGDVRRVFPNPPRFRNGAGE